MIKSVFSNSGTVTGHVTGSTLPYFAYPASAPAGQVRYNGTSQWLEVYDGSDWRPINQSISMDLSPEVQEILKWAQQRRQEDEELDRLCRDHPGVQAAREQLEIMRRLVKKESEKG
jgi:hypothetical protein